MTTTIIGLLVDRLGLARHAWLEPGRNIPQLRRRYSAIPGTEYRTRHQFERHPAGARPRAHRSARSATSNGPATTAICGSSPKSAPPRPASRPGRRPPSSSVTYTTEADSAVAPVIKTGSPSPSPRSRRPRAARPVRETQPRRGIRQASRDSWRLREQFFAGLLEHAAKGAGPSQIHDPHRPPPAPVPAPRAERRGDTTTAVDPPSLGRAADTSGCPTAPSPNSVTPPRTGAKRTPRPLMASEPRGRSAPPSRGLAKLLADEVERFGIDYVRGLTDKPERRPPAPQRQPLVFEKPVGPHDFD